MRANAAKAPFLPDNGRGKRKKRKKKKGKGALIDAARTE